MAHDLTRRRTGARTHHYDQHALTKRVGVGGLSFRAGKGDGAGLLQTRALTAPRVVRVVYSTLASYGTIKMTNFGHPYWAERTAKTGS